MPEMTIAELRAALLANIAAAVPDLPAPAQVKLVEKIAADLERTAAPLPAKRRFDAAVGQPDVVYAIPDNALNLIPTLVQAAISAFTKGPVGALSDLVALMFRYRSLRVVISAEEAAVLKVLKNAAILGRPPLAVADIRDELTRNELQTQRPLPELLAGLLAKKTDKTTLVTEAGGRWSIGNV